MGWMELGSLKRRIFTTSPWVNSQLMSMFSRRVAGSRSIQRTFPALETQFIMGMALFISTGGKYVVSILMNCTTIEGTSPNRSVKTSS